MHQNYYLHSAREKYVVQIEYKGFRILEIILNFISAQMEIFGNSQNSRGVLLFRFIRSFAELADTHCRRYNHDSHSSDTSTNKMLHPFSLFSLIHLS